MSTPTPDALRDPNRHTRMQQLFWKDDGTPFFGEPMTNGTTPVRIRGSFGSTVTAQMWRRG